MVSAADSRPVLAFDVGGTDIKSGLIQGPLLPGTAIQPGILDVQRLSTPRDPAAPADAVVDAVAALAEAYLARHPDLPPAAVGVTVPGLVDEAAGTGIYSANLGWRDYPFADRLRSRLGIPVAFGHDVAMAGEAEFRIGAARGRSDVLVLVIGTGIAGAVFADGRRVAGGGYAGEIGHAMVPLPDGSLQILEAVGSAGAIGSRYARLTAKTGNTADTGDTIDPGDARAVAARARQGEPAALSVWTEAAHAIAFGIAQCVSLLGTDTVVLGGGLAQAGPLLFDPVRARVDELLTFHRRPDLLAAELGQDAGLIGSALMARERLAAERSGA
ncbi:MAG: ROK family protein [Actinomycetales bacterium]